MLPSMILSSISGIAKLEIDETIEFLLVPFNQNKLRLNNGNIINRSVIRPRRVERNGRG